MTDEPAEAPRRRRKKRKPRPVYNSNYDIEIVRRRCTAIGTCMDEASRTFDMDDEAVAFVTNANGNSDEEILAAAKSCPVDAIFLKDKTTGERVWPLRDKRFGGEDSG
jgi:ferredoxin